jgi:UDP-2,3-diacylglucosamine hydrolase
MAVPQTLGIIAGNGVYPFTMLRAARKAGVARIVISAFVDETQPALLQEADASEWVRVGQLGKMIKFFKNHGVSEAVMVGQIAPKNLFDLRPDLRTLIMLGKLKRRNAETIFGAIGNELAKDGITLLSAVTFLEDLMPNPGHVCGPTKKDRDLADARFGLGIARESSRLDIGQTVVVKKGTVLAVEAFEGTNECIKRGGALGRGEAVMVKVSKPNQDFRFDVPVIGPATIETCAQAGIHLIAIEAGKTLLLELDEVRRLCDQHKISIHALEIAAAEL